MQQYYLPNERIEGGTLIELVILTLQLFLANSEEHKKLEYEITGSSPSE